MQTRGEKYFAVMAIKDGWQKPRFVWTGYRHLHIYDRRKDAARKAREMKADKLMEWCPSSEMRKNAPKTIPVRWIVCPVRVETMPEETNART
jgi:hypothetical protein